MSGCGLPVSPTWARMGPDGHTCLGPHHPCSGVVLRVLLTGPPSRPATPPPQLRARQDQPGQDASGHQVLLQHQHPVQDQLHLRNLRSGRHHVRQRRRLLGQVLRRHLCPGECSSSCCCCCCCCCCCASAALPCMRPALLTPSCASSPLLSSRTLLVSAGVVALPTTPPWAWSTLKPSAAHRRPSTRTTTSADRTWAFEGRSRLALMPRHPVDIASLPPASCLPAGAPPTARSAPTPRPAPRTAAGHPPPRTRLARNSAFGECTEAAAVLPVANSLHSASLSPDTRATFGTWLAHCSAPDKTDMGTLAPGSDCCNPATKSGSRYYCGACAVAGATCGPDDATW